MSGQNVVQLAPPVSPESIQRAKDAAMDELIDSQAQLLYRARTIWIDGLCLPWGMLTNGQRDLYRMEIEALIKGAE